MRKVLPVIVLSQFLCTSVWFASNAVISDLAKDMEMGTSFLAHLTSAVQFGFITGTLLFAIFTIADRFSPSKVFFACAVIASVFNAGMLLTGINPVLLLLLRFATGFFLAGIYPVGMKIASDHFQSGLGRSLGFLVGALVLGTAFPHLLRSVSFSFSWKYVVLVTSVLCIGGGSLVYLLVPDGPFRKRMAAIHITVFLHGFKDKKFRSVAMGYFGHMWELYTFWAFVPAMLATYNALHGAGLNVPLLSFLIIGSGMIACFISGMLSDRFGAGKLASGALAASGLCCIVSPVLFISDSSAAFLFFLFVWGMTVISDSPLFSSLVARYAPEQSRGSSLTIVNCIGFAITIVSIQFINLVSKTTDPKYIYMFLAIGPALGLMSMVSGKSSRKNT